MGYFVQERTRLGKTRRSRGSFLFGQTPAVGGSINELLLGTLVGADFNITTDQSITLLAGRYTITKILVTNASTNMTTAVGGFYTAASKAGIVVVPAAQVYSALVNAGVVLACMVQLFPQVTAQIYFALTTAQGAAATADISVYGVMS